jgi:hypothetical protein
MKNYIALFTVSLLSTTNLLKAGLNDADFDVADADRIEHARGVIKRKNEHLRVKKDELIPGDVRREIVEGKLRVGQQILANLNEDTVDPVVVGSLVKSFNQTKARLAEEEVERVRLIAEADRARRAAEAAEAEADRVRLEAAAAEAEAARVAAEEREAEWAQFAAKTAEAERARLEEEAVAVERYWGVGKAERARLEAEAEGVAVEKARREAEAEWARLAAEAAEADRVRLEAAEAEAARVAAEAERARLAAGSGK